MATLSKHINLTSSGITYALFFVGLVAIAHFVITQQWFLFAITILFPLLAILFVFAIKNPMVSYIVYAFVSCYFSAIYRYSDIQGLSGLVDVCIYFCLFSMLVNNLIHRGNIVWKNGINALTITYFIWICYCAFVLITPYSQRSSFITSYRGIFISLPLIYFISSTLLCDSKKLRITLYLLAFYALTATIKALWQKYHGWDHTEITWLMGGAWQTHILQTGIRYFSFYSDAGNFGSSIGMFAVLFGILGTVTKSKLFKLIYWIIAFMAFIGMMLSGTRGAMIVPFGGIALYALTSKNLKTIITLALVGCLTFSFFYFTDIGEDNAIIRRMRTAFRPQEDASFNVRLENQKRFARYLADKPFGMGVGGKVVDKETSTIQEEKYGIPTDSYYVGVWVEGGIVGLCLYIALQVIVLLRGCYIVMFNIKNRQLSLILAALLSSVFGIWLNGYVGNGIGLLPSSFLIAVFLSFVLNGPYIDRQLSKNEVII